MPVLIRNIRSGEDYTIETKRMVMKRIVIKRIIMKRIVMKRIVMKRIVTATKYMLWQLLLRMRVLLLVMPWADGNEPKKQEFDTTC